MRSASQAMKGGEGLDLAELLVQIGRGRADDEAVNALGGTSPQNPNSNLAQYP
jgi:hypothetical protein